MKVLIFFSFIFSVATQASECLIVSGVNQDFNNAFLPFKPALESGDQLIPTKKCKVFTSWDNLSEYVDSKNSKENFLIVQAAHGIQGGGSILDSQRVENSKKMVDIINAISEKHKVGLFLQTCYSGDVMVEKIARDESDYNAAKDSIEKSKILDRLKNLCLITSSVPSFVSISAQPIGSGLNNDKPISILPVLGDKNNFGKNLEDLQSVIPQGLISSGAYSSYGLSQYFLDKNAIDSSLLGIKLIETLNTKDVRNDLQCGIEENNYYYNLSKLCLNHVFSKSFLVTLYNIKEIGDRYKISFGHNFANKLKSMNKSSLKNCYDSFFKQYKKTTKDDATENGVIKLQDLYNVVSLFRTTSAENCQDLSEEEKKTFQDDSSQLFLGYVGMAPAITDKQFLMSMKELHGNIPFLNTSHSPDTILTSIDQNYSKLPSFYKQSNHSGTCLELLVNGNDLTDFNKFSTNTPGQIILSSFNNFSKTIEGLPSELDQARREACREIKLE
jgi:hypothetical protein